MFGSCMLERKTYCMYWCLYLCHSSRGWFALAISEDHLRTLWVWMVLAVLLVSSMWLYVVSCGADVNQVWIQ